MLTVSIILVTLLLLNSLLDRFLTPLIFLDCLDQGRLLPLDYFHRPVPVEGLEDVGQGVVIGVTNYQVRYTVGISIEDLLGSQIMGICLITEWFPIQITILSMDW